VTTFYTEGQYTIEVSDWCWVQRRYGTRTALLLFPASILVGGGLLACVTDNGNLGGMLLTLGGGLMVAAWACAKSWRQFQYEEGMRQAATYQAQAEGWDAYRQPCMSQPCGAAQTYRAADPTIIDELRAWGANRRTARIAARVEPRLTHVEKPLISNKR